MRLVQSFRFSNSIGLWTLYVREVRRFMKVYSQTLVGPAVTALLFLAVFSLALGRAVETVAGVPFLSFLAPGLIMMLITQNAFANTSSSMMISKIQGNIVDTLMPSLTPLELTLGFAAGGVTRGIIVGVFVGLMMSVFVPIGFASPFFIVFHAISASLMMSNLGLIAGIWAEKFDHMAAITNFIITPLTFLSGTFYSIERLPEFGRLLAHLNPLFYMIDGFRYGFIGQSDSAPLIGVVVLCGVNLVLLMICFLMFRSGYKLKA